MASAPGRRLVDSTAPSADPIEFNAAFIDRVLADHRRWQEQELDRQVSDVYEQLVGRANVKINALVDTLRKHGFLVRRGRDRL